MNLLLTECGQNTAGQETKKPHIAFFITLTHRKSAKYTKWSLKRGGSVMKSKVERKSDFYHLIVKLLFQTDIRETSLSVKLEGSGFRMPHYLHINIKPQCR
ncbi:hypothetical protein AMECASPLE_033274 [Ameca splendens]|uniref:Uncharacterized protein n=1 Tax=Ameca splendens TaxID=208324 RepID=A0ABV0YTS9_9TELE